jgi:hypothetical protein
VSDEQETQRLRERLDRGRVQAEALCAAQRWPELADLARELGRVERDLALRGTSAGAKPGGPRVFVQG